MINMAFDDEIYGRKKPRVNKKTLAEIKNLFKEEREFYPQIIRIKPKLYKMFERLYNQFYDPKGKCIKKMGITFPEGPFEAGTDSTGFIQIGEEKRPFWRSQWKGIMALFVDGSCSSWSSKWVKFSNALQGKTDNIYKAGINSIRKKILNDFSTPKTKQFLLDTVDVELVPSEVKLSPDLKIKLSFSYNAAERTSKSSKEIEKRRRLKELVDRLMDEADLSISHR